MSRQKQIEANNKNKIKLLFTVKRLVDAFLFLFGVLIVAGLILDSSKPLLPPHPASMEWMMRWINYLRTLQELSISMIISGIMGIIISAVITIILSVRLKKHKSTYIKQEYGHIKDFLKSQRSQHKIVTPPKWS
ncbi:hypothetical protein LCGC14_2057520 [marine sediment metagenome]|uniref:Uncharacterized protein n=1 Tax=marine sediment metagenome TaxID=412755 RepID=A0A0F9EM08_9ZZZZ